MFGQQLSAEDRILKQRVQILRDERFVANGGVMMVGSWSVEDDLPTAATNGRDVFFGREFVDSCSDPLLRFVILHEEYHKMFQHMFIYKKLFDEDPKLANLAADYVINGILDNIAGPRVDGFIEVWEHAALDHQYDGLDTAEVYRRLKQQQAQQQQQGGGKGKGGSKPQHRSASGGEAQDFDEHQADGSASPHALSEEERAQAAQQIDTAIRQGQQMAGRMGGKRDRVSDALLEPTVDWAEQLQDWLKTTAKGDDLATWRRLSRRWLARDIKQPSRYTESVHRIVLGIDTSGSIGEDQLRRALTEIAAACDHVKPEIVDVIYWDAEVAAHETYEGDAVNTLAEATKPKGGGGTRVGAMLEYMQSKDLRPDCIIQFTDGYVEQDWGGAGWPAPVLWCVSTKGMTAPNGKTLYVPAE